jgi:hypothetical protein
MLHKVYATVHSINPREQEKKHKILSNKTSLDLNVDINLNKSLMELSFNLIFYTFIHLSSKKNYIFFTARITDIFFQTNRFKSLSLLDELRQINIADGLGVVTIQNK